MILLQTTINIGEVVEKTAEHWYNENWVGFILTALSAIVAAYFAIRVVKVDHTKQRETREQEKKEDTIESERVRTKESKDLRSYIYEMSDALLDLVDEQIKIHKDLIDFMAKNPYTGIEKKQVAALNLNNLSYVTPKQAYEIFVAGLPSNSQENSKRLREYHRQLQRIEAAKKIDADTTARIGAKLEQSFQNFIEVVQALNTYKVQVEHEIVKKNLFDHTDFANKLSILFRDFGLKSKKLKYDQNNQVVPNDDTKLPESEKINLALVSKEHLFEKINQLLYKQEFLKVNYRADFLDLVNKGNIALSEYDVLVTQYSKSIQNSADTLKEASEKVRKILKELKELYHD